MWHFTIKGGGWQHSRRREAGGASEPHYRFLQVAAATGHTAAISSGPSETIVEEIAEDSNESEHRLHSKDQPLELASHGDIVLEVMFPVELL